MMGDGRRTDGEAVRDSDTDYVVRPYEAADLPQVLALLQRSLGGGPTGERSAEFFTWKHDANPFGRSLALVAAHGSDIIGLRTLARWRFLSGGRTVTAVRAVDTATDPAHQGRGIFSRLTTSAIEVLSAEGVELIFNTPNEKSLPGYRKMGWSEVGRLPIALRPVRGLRFARGVRSAGQGPPSGDSWDSSVPPIDDLLGDDAALQPLLDEAQPDDGRLATHRDGSFLRWRYAAAPGLDYRGIAVEDGGRLVGLAIGRARMRGGLREFTLSEVIVRDGDRQTAGRLLRAVTRSGCDHVAAHLTPGSALPTAGRRHGYFQVPGQGMLLAAKPLAALGPDPTRVDSWRLSLGDLEVF
jgi:GNAT superfamily N-acetyltransferase